MTPEAMTHIHAAANADGSAWSVEDFESLLSSPTVFAVGDGPCFCLARVVADEAEILTIATHPDDQGKGHATRVLALFESEARNRNALTAFLEVAEDNQPARALYTACGYAQTGLRKGYYRRQKGQNADALLMSKALTKG